MHDDGEDLIVRGPRFTCRLAEAILFCARAAHGYRVHGFQVAGIRYQVNADFGPSGVWYSPVAPT